MNIHGGIVHTLTVTGDADIHGGIVKQLIVHGNCTQYGGIVKQRVIMAAGPTDTAKAEPNSAQKRDAPYTAQTQDKRISRLNEQLEKALNRERVAVMSRRDAQKELAKIMANQWDSYRPTKEEVRRYYNVLLALLDCENTY